MIVRASPLTALAFSFLVHAFAWSMFWPVQTVTMNSVAKVEQVEFSLVAKSPQRRLAPRDRLKRNAIQTATAPESLPSRMPSAQSEASESSFHRSNFFLTPPEYPARCRDRLIEGTAVVEIKFKNNGTFHSASVVKGVEECPEFSQAAIRSARGARLNPVLSSARLDNDDTRSAIIPFRFQLNK